MSRCEHSDDSGAYVLRALDESTASEFSAHLAECEACRREVAELQVVADNLPLAAPQVVPPLSVRDRIMAAIEPEAQLLRAAGSGADRPAVSKRRRWLPALGLRPVLAGGVVACAAAIAVVLAVSSGGGSGARTFAASLAPAGAKVAVKVSGGRAELSVAGMPSTPVGKVYEVWLVKQGDAPRPTHALFGVRADGRAVVKVPERLGNAEAVWVTAEPSGGSVVPTSAPVIKTNLA
jgi:anti-sigma-K factor RskA